MKLKLKVFLSGLLFFTTFFMWAQATKTVVGTVTDADGIALPGVNVVIKGTAIGSVTDFDGKYSIKADETSVVVFSYLGYETQEVLALGKTNIDIQLIEDAESLNEVVVTALGAKRNAREVVYANQTVKADELMSQPSKNALEALRGKVAGVKLSTASGSVGASTRIVLRGEGTLTGDNNALIVVDGIPIDNNTSTGGDESSTGGYADYGNRFNDLNPDDIESMTILKGPSATSLYGSRGASGVVVITTKTGGSSKMKINFNSSVSAETAIINLKRQNKFGQGYDGIHFDSGENWSWGPEVDGVVRPWTSVIDSDGDGAFEALIRPYSAVDNQLEDFFNTGYTLTNGINLSGSSNGFNYYTSFSNTTQTGTLDNTEYKRNNAAFNASGKLSKKLTAGFKVTYANTRQNTAQEGSRAFEGNNAYAMAVQSPITIPFKELRDYTSPYHDINGYWGSYSSVNPYFILNEYGNEADIDNVLLNTSLDYKVTDDISLTGRFGTNIVNTAIETWTPAFTPDLQTVWGDDLEQIPGRGSRHESDGAYESTNIKRQTYDATVLGNYNKSFGDDFELKATVGYNFFQRNFERLTGNTIGGLVVPGVFNLSNGTEGTVSEQEREKYRIYGVLGNTTLGYKNAAFLEFSIRNDWSSTLPKQNNSFLYGAAGASLIFTDLFDIQNDVLNYGKLRASYGTTGKDAEPYLLNSVFSGNPDIVNLGDDFSLNFPKNGIPGFTLGNVIGNPELKPELTTTFEAGADLSFFDNIFNVSYTYYKSTHSDQIVEITLPRSTGYTLTSSNVGEMINKGHELTLSLSPLKNVVKGLDFELFANYSTNDNEVIKISEETDELTLTQGPFLASYSGVTLVAKEGLPFGTFRALAPLTNDAGQVVVDPNTGFPLYTEDEQYLGSYQPDYLLSFGTNINYKGFGLKVLVDMKEGGTFLSQTKASTEFNGTALHTTDFNREPFVLPNSVIDNGDGTFSANTIEVTEQDYYTNYDAAPSTLLVDASFVKLREVELSYTFPSKFLGDTGIERLRLALYGKNLKFWLPSENTFADPEVNGPGLTGNSQGIETTQVPSSRSLGVNLQLTF